MTNLNKVAKISYSATKISKFRINYCLSWPLIEATMVRHVTFLTWGRFQMPTRNIGENDEKPQFSIFLTQRLEMYTDSWKYCGINCLKIDENATVTNFVEERIGQDFQPSWVLRHLLKSNEDIDSYCNKTYIHVYYIYIYLYLRDWSRSGGSYGNNTRVICCPALGRPESAARVICCPAPGRPEQLEGRPRRTTNHEGVVALAPDRPWSIPIITWL